MDQIVVNESITPAEGPNDAALAAAGEAAVNAGNTHSEKPQRPEGVPEKFWDAEKGQINTEALLKSYSELERTREQKPEEKTEENSEQGTQVAKIESVEHAQELAKSKGIDFNALEQEYLANGDLSADTYKALADKGIPNETVKAFIEGQKASAQVQRAELLKDVGGEDGYQEIVSWAKDSLSKDEIAAYNRAIATNDKGIMQMAIAQLHSRYRAANGTPPKSQIGGKTSGPSSAAEPFASREQYVDAIKDARYERDPAYRAQVLMRLKASNIF